jgi:hypothetical protein
MVGAELPSGICAVNLKPVVSAVWGNQTEVVQHRGAKSSFFVDHRTPQVLNG